MEDIKRQLLFEEGSRFFKKSFHRRALTYVVRQTEDKAPVSYTHLDVYKRQVSTCNSGWKKSPEQSNKWLEENMFPQYPLGDLKDI